MNPEYEQYCASNPYFYDQSRDKQSDSFALQLPEAWSQHLTQQWCYCNKKGIELPPQGWKIHVSATLTNAQKVLNTVAEYCIQHNICFKYVPSLEELHLKNGKNANRASSGKFITIYPINDNALYQVLIALDSKLKGQNGPYILSDLRWSNGPLYVRYGGFTQQMTKIDGVEVPAIYNTDGDLVPDERVPYFKYPDWAHVPDFLVPKIAAFEKDDASLPFKVNGALKISNGGGVYKCVYHNDDAIIKEGRPYAGLDGQSISAYSRIDNEAYILNKLQGISGIPKIYSHFHVWEHNYLAMEFIDGDALTTYVSDKNTLIQEDTGKDQYAERTVALIKQLKAIIDTVHQRNISIGDLQISNVIVNEYNKVYLIDFEVATDRETGESSLGMPGFMATNIDNRFRKDNYALACIALYLFSPFNPELQLAPDLVSSRIDFIQQHFGLKTSHYIKSLFDLADPQKKEKLKRRYTAAGLKAIKRNNLIDVSSSIMRGVLSTRKSTSCVEYPSDICVYQGRADSLSAGYGLAGIIMGAYRLNLSLDKDLISELDSRIAKKTFFTKEDYGLFTGISGSICVLTEMGFYNCANRFINELKKANFQDVNLNLSSGLAGLLLAIASLRQQILGCDEIILILLREILARVTNKSESELGKMLPDAGLSNGCSGLALALSSLIKIDIPIDKVFLSRLVRQLLKADVLHCKSYKDGSLQADDDYRLLPYVGKGSAGILIAESLARRNNIKTVSRESITRLLKACTSPYYMESGLLRGISGIIAALELESTGDNQIPQDIMDTHLEDLSLHAMLNAKGNYFFTGSEGLRISTDLLSGMTGIALVLKDLANCQENSLPLSWLPINNSNYLWS